jgi:ABC-type phosphate transport system permease subunit
MGETIAVMLVIGSIDRIPKLFYNIFSPAQTITSKLGREAAEAVGMGMHWNALIGLGLILFILVAVFTFFGNLAFATTAHRIIQGNKG